VHEDDALALDEARMEDAVTCEGCGATFDVAEVILSPYEADDGGAYCTDCATTEWARLVEECSRLREALQAIALLATPRPPAMATAQRIARVALAPWVGARTEADDAR
jgi:hypothetical protein